MTRIRVDQLLQQMAYTTDEAGWFVAMRRATEGLTAKQAGWRPGGETNTIWQTVNHLAFWKGLVARRIGGAPLSEERISNMATFGPPGDPADEPGWQAALIALSTSHQALTAAVERLQDSDLALPPPGEDTPLGDLLTGLTLHDLYHLGQIVLIRKLQGAWSRT